MKKKIVVVFIIIVMLLTGSNYYMYGATEFQSIGTSLIENGNIVAYRNYGDASEEKWNEGTVELLKEIDKDNIIPGKKYKEEFRVRNTGHINTYVMVQIYKNWIDEDGSKSRIISPEAIKLDLGGDGWMEDEPASTYERTVLYYDSIVEVGKETPNFINTLSIDPEFGEKVEFTKQQNEDGTITITSNKKYNGARFKIEIQVNAIQENNVIAAIDAAWGRAVDIDENGKLVLL